ncbi:hypothetical protein J6590_052149 [Homalodisca vitripennis]|nr:hypothetical protein J6590_052149 [Homalodisca vitripennis]
MLLWNGSTSSCGSRSGQKILFVSDMVRDSWKEFEINLGVCCYALICPFVDLADSEIARISCEAVVTPEPGDEDSTFHGLQSRTGTRSDGVTCKNSR